MSASVNNDGLAEALLLAAMMVLLRWMRSAFYTQDDTARRNGARKLTANMIPLLVLGILLGLGMVTKIYAYAGLVLAAGMVGLVVWLKPNAVVDRYRTVHPTWRGFKYAVLAVLCVVAPAVLIGLPLWLRNIQLYGQWDILGLSYHDAVVVGQPTTAAWLEQNGLMAFVERALTYTFRSFWGVFGWMGVFMDTRIYTLLLVFTGVIFFGLLWAVVRFISGRPETDMDRYQFWVLGFFSIMALAVAASYVAYNVKFVQHQGRYFLWGILPISVFVALGWREVMQPLQGKVTGFLAGVLTISLVVASLFTPMQDRMIIAALGMVALLLMLQPFLLSGAVDAIIIGAPYRLQRWLSKRPLQPWLAVLRTLAWAMPFVLLWLLTLAVPFWYIQPQLALP
ncbi:MAG: hypothetical protein IPK16_07290 [Anaerolineales bacterium]|nr:hypothetical protein [Anaerolineales bacterium]